MTDEKKFGEGFAALGMKVVESEALKPGQIALINGDTGKAVDAFEIIEKLTAERDALKAENARLMDALETAWMLIANASGGDWDRERPEWVEAAKRWRDDEWHTALDRNLAARRALGEAE